MTNRDPGYLVAYFTPALSWIGATMAVLGTIFLILGMGFWGWLLVTLVHLGLFIIGYMNGNLPLALIGLSLTTNFAARIFLT